MDAHNDVEALRARIQQLETELASLRNQGAAQTKGPEAIETPLSEADATLRRLVQRIAMILQAEKIVIMFHDRERGELLGIPPAFGVDEEHLKRFRVRATQGISGEVYREGEPRIFHDAITDNRTEKDNVAMLGVHSGVCVPLVIEKRDEENRVVDRSVIGVLHAFNKRYGEDFNEEDVRLLERMAKNVGSIIANLQLYREVVEEREELLQTFESLTAGILLIGPEGRVAQANASARYIFQLKGESVGKPFPDVIRNGQIHDLVNMVMMGAESPQIEVDQHIAGTDRTYQVQATRVQSEDRDLGVVCIFTDVTEIKNLERMKSSFVAMASHELRTPLTAIKGFSSTLLDGVGTDMYTDDDQREFLGIVVHECDRLRRLIDDLLNTSRIEAGESLAPNYSEFSVGDLIDKVAKIQAQATTKHTVKVDIQSPLPPLMVGDQDKLDQSLTNLMNNAIKYSPEGGDVTITAKVTGNTLLVGVHDQGMGIPKEHLSRVFERFHRVNNEDNRKIYGTGLGLYLVKHLIEKVHMGRIWCESEVGKGSTFWFEVPTNLDIEEAKKFNDK